MNRAGLRRASRRLGLALAAAVLVVLAAVTVLRVLGSRELASAAESFEAAVGPLDFEAYRPAAVPDRENAALPILEALDRLDHAHDAASWREEIVWLRQANRRPATAWSEEDRRRVRAVLDAGRDVLEPLERAAGRPGASFGLDYAAGPMMEIPNFLHVLEASDLLLAQARLAWLDGRPRDGAAAVEALETLGRALETEAPLIFQIVGHGVEIRQYRAIQAALADRGWAPEERTTLLRLRATTDERPRSELVQRSLGAEGAFLYSLRPGGEYARAVAQEQPWPQRVAYRWRGYGSIAAGLDYYGRVAKVYPTHTALGMSEDRARTTPPRDGGTRPILANFQTSLETFKAAESLRRLARQALDLAAIGARRRALPDALPSTPPADPFTGALPVYARSADGSATLTVPGAAELWERVNPVRIRAGDEAPLFTWTLAAPADGGPAQGPTPGE